MSIRSPTQSVYEWLRRVTQPADIEYVARSRGWNLWIAGIWAAAASLSFAAAGEGGSAAVIVGSLVGVLFVALLSDRRGMWLLAGGLAIAATNYEQFRAPTGGDERGPVR